jgi:hypothetical protein
MHFLTHDRRRQYNGRLAAASFLTPYAWQSIFKLPGVCEEGSEMHAGARNDVYCFHRFFERD